MSTVPPVYTNQFEQGPMKGDLDLAIQKSGVIAGVLGAVAGDLSLDAGTRVKIDTSVTAAGTVQFVFAADNEAAFGVLKRTAQKATFSEGDQVEVSFSGGPVVYECGSTTIAPGTSVAMSSGFLAAVDGTHLVMGMLIDYVVQNSMGRVVIGFRAS